MTILYNDQLIDSQNCHINPEDRGYQFGDGIYEVIQVYQGHFFCLQEHLNRLFYSAEQINLPLVYDSRQISELLHNLIKQNQLITGQIYLQITRGYAPRNHAFPQDVKPVLTAYTMTKPQPSAKQIAGAKAITTEDIRWLRCDIKSLNLLANVLSKQLALDNNVDEAILHRDRTVTEGSSANIFIVKNGRIQTHPANNFILNGITRQVVLRLIKENDTPCLEEPFSLEKLYQADEVFLTGTTVEVLPVISIDNRAIGDGKTGVISKQLLDQFHQLY